ncbi:MAG: LPS export ABC transporter permease LptG [gamma proteobacterium symbiont of Bathyaustriella thionipta]|nr:LPS export ABC transporter permease LptG [gamma proteobacterium symbiont of Bathyaustriella thionipta]
MSLLNRYIGKQILQGYLLVFASLLGIFSIVRFMVELEDVGDGSYSSLDALYYLLLTMPSQLIFLAPVSVFLGSLIPLANLSRHGELIAIRTAGYPIARIARAILWPALGLMLFLLLLSEVISPVLYKQAVQMRQQAVQGKSALDVVSNQEIWSRKGDRFINIGQLEFGQVPAEIRIYEFSEDRKMRLSLFARRAKIQQDGNWQLSGVKVGQYKQGKWQVSYAPVYRWKPFITPQQLEKQFVPMESLSISEHWRFLQYLKDSKLRTGEAGLAFWIKVVQPLLIPFMALLSLYVIFANPRSSHFVLYLVLGILIAAFYLLARQVIHNVGQVLELKPQISAFIPLLLVILGDLWIFWWFRRKV